MTAFFTSYLDGSPTPAWVLESQRRAEAQRQAALVKDEDGWYRIAERSPRAEQKRKPTRDWLAPSPLRLP